MTNADVTLRDDYQSLHFYQSIMENIGIRVFCVNSKYRLLYCNKMAEGLITKKKQEAMSLLGALDTALEEVMKQCVEQKTRLVGVEVMLEHPRRLWLSVDSFYLTRSGDIQSYVFVLREMNDNYFRKFREFNDRSLQSLVALSAGLAHEIRNPLQSMSLHLELLRRTLPQKSEGQAEVDVLTSEVERLNALVESFMKMVRPKRVEKKLQDLVGVIGEVIDFMHPVASNQEVSITYEGEERIDYMLDRDGIKQLLINLLKNSIEAKKEGIPLHINISTTLRRNTLQLTIADDGVGMSRETLEQVLTPFFTTKPSGEGLGMMMAYRIVEQHGGQMGIDSKQGEYTTVEILLPYIHNYIEEKTE